jgi:hypothetical protein
MNNERNRKEYIIRFRTRDGQIKSAKRWGVSATQVIVESTNETAIVELLGCRLAEDMAFHEMVSAGLTRARTW